nr:hypothetical protein [Phytohalomonas tamaricis]
MESLNASMNSKSPHRQMRAFYGLSLIPSGLKTTPAMIVAVAFWILARLAIRVSRGAGFTAKYLAINGHGTFWHDDITIGAVADTFFHVA